MRNSLKISVALLAVLLMIPTAVMLSADGSDAELPPGNPIFANNVPFPGFSSFGGVTGPLPTEPESIVYDGVVDLTADKVFPDGSKILIKNNTTINLHDFKVDLGSDSIVHFVGTFIINGEEGSSITVGPGTLITGDYIAFFPPEKVTTYTFDGSLEISMFLDPEPAYGTEIEFTPTATEGIITATTAVSDTETHSTYISSSDSIFKVTVASFDDFKNHTDFTGGNWIGNLVFTDGLSFTSDFERIGTVNCITDDEGFKNTKDICFYADTSASPTISAKTENGTIVFEEVNIKDMSVVSSDEKTQDVKDLRVYSIHSVDADIDSEKKLRIRGEADRTVYEESRAGSVTHHAELTNLHLAARWDLSRLSGITDSLSDIEALLSTLDYVGFTADKLTAYTPETKDSPLVLENVLVELLRGSDEKYHLLIRFTRDNTSYEIVFSDAKVNRFGLNRDFVLDLEVIIGETVVKVTEESGKSRLLTLNDLVLTIDSMDLLKLRDAYTKNFGITPQDIIDSSKFVTLEAKKLALDNEADGNTDASGTGIVLDLRKDRKDLSHVSADIDSMKGTIFVKDTPLYLDLALTTIEIESDTSVSEIDPGEDRNNHIKVTMSTARLHASAPFEYDSGKGTAVFDIAKRGTYYSTDSACLEIQVNFTAESEDTQIKMRYDFGDYDSYLEISGDFKNPTGKGTLRLDTKDMAGSSNIMLSPSENHSTKISGEVSLEGSMAADLDYYGIAFSIAGEGFSLKLNSSSITIKDYDYLSDGIENIFEKLSGHESETTIKGIITMDEGTLNDEGQALYRKFTDLLVRLGDVEITKVPDSYVKVVVDNSLITAKISGGRDIYRELNNFVTVKDLGQPETEPVPNDPSHHVLPALLLLVIFSSVCYAYIVITYRRRTR